MCERVDIIGAGRQLTTVEIHMVIGYTVIDILTARSNPEFIANETGNWIYKSLCCEHSRVMRTNLTHETIASVGSGRSAAALH